MTQTHPMTERCSKMITEKTGNDKAAYSYRLVTEAGEPITSGKRPQTTASGATRYASVGAASKAAAAYAARTGEQAIIDLA